MWLVLEHICCILRTCFVWRSCHLLPSSAIIAVTSGCSRGRQHTLVDFSLNVTETKVCKKNKAVFVFFFTHTLSFTQTHHNTADLSPPHCRFITLLLSPGTCHVIPFRCYYPTYTRWPHPIMMMGWMWAAFTLLDTSWSLAHVAGWSLMMCINAPEPRGGVIGAHADGHVLNEISLPVNRCTTEAQRPAESRITDSLL